MSTEPQLPDGDDRPRLSGRERLSLAALTLLSVAAVLISLGTAFATTITLFGEQATARQTAIAGHALRAALWALVTPFVGWRVLRRGSRSWIGVAIWLGLLGWCSWWWWPTPPTGVFDNNSPVWHSAAGAVLWTLVAAGLAGGLYAALRSNRSFITKAAAGVAILTVALGAVSYLHLNRRAAAERPVPLAQGVVELAALRADPLWAALPHPAQTTARGEHEASRTLWGERTTTSMWRYLGDRYDPVLFRETVAVAEANGWRLVGTMCGQYSWEANFDKSLDVGAARLRISIASYTKAVGVFAQISETTVAGGPGKCWEAPK
jgi:hypothetical protein